MSGVNSWFSAADLVAMRIAGMPATERGMHKCAAREGWEWRNRKGRGGGKEYALSAMPKAAREAIQDALLKNLADAGAAAALPSVPAVRGADIPSASPRRKGCLIPIGRQKPREHVDPKQAAYRDAAAILCREVFGLAALLDCSEKRACRVLAERVERGEAPAHVAQADDATYLKKRTLDIPEKRISARFRRIERMTALWRAGEMEGDALKYLIPGARGKEGHDPVHVAAFLRFFCHPSRPAVTQAHAAMSDWLRGQGIQPPSYSVATRIENSLPVTVKYRGRMTGAEWRALKPYIDRDVSMFRANDIWVGDGHGFKARIQSPVHGQAFQPEVTVVLDWVSRKVVGWSVALSESTIAVSAAFRHAQMQTRARPLIYYSDNGSGQTGKKIDHPIFGSLARQGIGHETGIPGNPQGRGVIERLWQTLTIPLAKTYPTVLTRDADRDTVRKVTNILDKAQRAGEDSTLLPSWSQFISDLDAAIDHYNANHRHRELGGMTPDEAYAAKLDPDSIVFSAADDEIRELWMPEVERTPNRGVVRLLGNEYSLCELPDVLEEKEKVRVRYDIHDAGRVWLYRRNGAFLGEALWDGHKVAAFPVPEVEQKRYERARGIKARAQRESDRADAELADTYDALQDHQTAPLPPMQVNPVIEGEAVRIAPAPAQEERPRLETMGDYSLLTWLSEHPEDWTTNFRRYFARMAARGSRVIEEALDEYGLWGELEAEADFKTAS